MDTPIVAHTLGKIWKGYKNPLHFSWKGMNTRDFWACVEPWLWPSELKFEGQIKNPRVKTLQCMKEWPLHRILSSPVVFFCRFSHVRSDLILDLQPSIIQRKGTSLSIFSIITVHRIKTAEIRQQIVSASELRESKNQNSFPHFQPRAKLKKFRVLGHRMS